MDGRDEEGLQEEIPSRDATSYSSILPSMPSGDGDNQDLQPVAPQAVRHPHFPMTGGPAYELTPGYTPPPGSSLGPILPSSLPMRHPAYSDSTTGSGTYSTLPPLDASSGTGMPSSGSILPSSSPMGHSAYSPLTTREGTYSTLPPFDASPSTVMPGAGSILPSRSPTGHSPYSPLTTGPGTHYSTLPPFDALPAGPSYPGYESYQSPQYNYGSGGQYSYDANSAMPHASFGGMAGYQPGYAHPQAPTGVGYAGMGSYSAYGAQGYSYLGGGEYPQQYKGQPQHGAYGAPRRGRGHHLGPPRSFAKNPGRPIVNSDNRENPGGVTLFVFYIPNDMTNHDLHELFKVHGNILSVSIKTEEDTGRGKGFGFVSFESAESAASAIQHLNGYQIQGKRLKVDYKKNKREEKYSHEHYQPHSGLGPPRDFARPYEPRLNYHQPPVSDFVPIQDHVEEEYSKAKQSAEGSFPVQEKSVPQSREQNVYKSVLPPFEHLSGASDSDSYVSGEKNAPSSPAPFADLSDIGTALPDTED